MVYAFGDYEVDILRMELRRAGAPVALEPQVFSLLCLLVENRDRLVSKDEILEKIWDGRVVSESALSSRIKSVRQAVGDDGAAQRIIRTLRGRGFRFVAQLDTADRVETSAPRAGGTGDAQATPAAGAIVDARPTLAVLPFQWIGDGGSHAIIAEALPHELITALSRLRWLAVIARGSAFRFRSNEADVRAIGRALSASYCVMGVIESRRRGVALTVDLIDARNGRVLWGEQFAFEIDGVHEIRSGIVASIVAALEIRIPQNEASIARLAPPESLDAWAEYHLGLQAMYRFNKQDNAAATVHFRRAVQIDPGFARAYAGLSFTSFQDAFLKYANDTDEARELARRYAARGVELDPYDPFANLTMGRSFFLTGELETSLGWLERSTALSPNFAQGLYSRGWAETLAGRSLVGRTYVDDAMQLSPLDPLMYAMMGTRALSHIEQNELVEAVSWAERAANAPGSHVLLGFIATAAWAIAGNEQRAAHWAENVKARRPDVTRALFFQSFPFADSEMRLTLERALAQHGL